MNITGYDAIGLLGVLIVLGAYLALVLRRLRGDTLWYPLLNLIGAAAITLALLYDLGLNIPALLMQIAWLLISGYGIYRALAGKAPKQDRP